MTKKADKRLHKVGILGQTIKYRLFVLKKDGGGGKLNDSALIQDHNSTINKRALYEIDSEAEAMSEKEFVTEYYP